MERYVAYYRVSTNEQSNSGLGIEAQKAMVSGFLKGQKPTAEFTETESGKNDKRPMLAQALEMCRKENLTLVIAKLDRLSRNLTFISSLMDAKTKFVCADMPEANELTIHIFAVMAQAERKLISERTRSALKALKDRGVKLGKTENLGGPKAVEASLNSRRNKRLQDKNYTTSKAHAELLRKEGLTLKQIADSMNEKGYSAKMGGKLTSTHITRLLK